MLARQQRGLRYLVMIARIGQVQHQLDALIGQHLRHARKLRHAVGPRQHLGPFRIAVRHAKHLQLRMKLKRQQIVIRHKAAAHNRKVHYARASP